METIQIEFQPNLKSKILDLLSTFSKDEIKISSVESEQFFDPNFAENKRILDLELEKVRNGTAIVFTCEEVDAFLEVSISKYES